MKTSSRKEREERLLSEVFAEDFDASQPGKQEMNEILREFRIGYWRRKAVRSILSAAAVIAVAGLALSYFRSAPSNPVPDAAIAESAQHSVPTTIKSISDEELLALFPPDSCFLAEFDGKQVLVFKDPALADQFLE